MVRFKKVLQLSEYELQRDSKMTKRKQNALPAEPLG